MKAYALTCLACLAIILTSCSGEATGDPAVSGANTGQDNLPGSSSAPLTPQTTVLPGLTPAVVTRVVDGDTIYVSINGDEYRLRYIGIDTPELAHFGDPIECLAQEAQEYNERLVLGQAVGLEKDVSETDDFGRLLRYVWLGNEMVNARLVSDGYANAATYPPDVRYAEMFAALQAEARTAGRGLWGAVCPD